MYNKQREEITEGLNRIARIEIEMENARKAHKMVYADLNDHPNLYPGGSQEKAQAEWDSELRKFLQEQATIRRDLQMPIADMQNEIKFNGEPGNPKDPESDSNFLRAATEEIATEYSARFQNRVRELKEDDELMSEGEDMNDWSPGGSRR